MEEEGGGEEQTTRSEQAGDLSVARASWEPTAISLASGKLPAPASRRACKARTFNMNMRRPMDGLSEVPELSERENCV